MLESVLYIFYVTSVTASTRYLFLIIRRASLHTIHTTLPSPQTTNSIKQYLLILMKENKLIVNLVIKQYECTFNNHQAVLGSLDSIFHRD